MIESVFPLMNNFIKSLPPYKDVVHAYAYNKKDANNNPDYQYKEAYLFCLQTGLRQTDLSRLCWRHIISEVDDKGKFLNEYVSNKQKIYIKGSK